MGNEVGRSNTHVANATGAPIRVYYSVDKMTMEEMVVEVGGELGGSFSGSSGSVSGKVTSSTKMVFKRDSRVRYIRIPARDFSKFSGEGTIYVSVFMEKSGSSDDWEKTICMNFHIPLDRSFIVTRNHNIKFQKYGASIWVDESGFRHDP